MGLDAVVYCDCFERGSLREAPPSGWQVSVAADGSLLCGSEDLDVQLAFDQWQLLRACEHQMGILLHEYIGNIALVADLRAELQCHASQFPLLRSKVLYNGTHCGNFIVASQVGLLKPEIEALSNLPCHDEEKVRILRDFKVQMRDLVACALTVGKLISF